MKNHLYYIYIITDRYNRYLYTGVTNNLARRITEHRAKLHNGFASRRNCTKLVYFERFRWIRDAIAREKQIKAGARQKKVNLINQSNPNWEDQFDQFSGNEFML